MFNLLKLASLVLMKTHEITDENSWRVFLRELILFIESHAEETKIPFDDDLLRHLEVIVTNKGLFTYIYQLISEQLQTQEILFESVGEESIVELVEQAATSSKKNPEAINPVLIISFVREIISIINTIKKQ